MAAPLRPWVDALGSQPEVLDAGVQLVARYAEPHRHYHDRRHLGEVLQALSALAGETPPPVPAVLAAYWHDAVYEPTRADNEQRSAALAAVTLQQLGVAPTDVEEVVRLVLLTRTHEPGDGDRAGALLCDADLAILAAPAARYLEYASGVRREYGHLDDEAFRAGRAGVLRSLETRPRLFTTDSAHRRWDEKARANLRSELGRLDAGRLP